MRSKLSSKRGEPGMFTVREPDGQTRQVKLVDWTEGWRYDTVEIVQASTPTNGQEYHFFRDITGKEKTDTNFTSQHRLPAGESMIVNNVGVYPHINKVTNVSALPLEIRWAMERLYLLMEVNGYTVVKGPAICFPSGLGVTGSTEVANETFATNGVASLAAVPRLLVPIELTHKMDIEAKLIHHTASWITGAAPYAAPTIATSSMLLKLFLRGFIKKLVGRGG